MNRTFDARRGVSKCQSESGSVSLRNKDVDWVVEMVYSARNEEGLREEMRARSGGLNPDAICRWRARVREQAKQRAV